jgi:Nitrile hydratase beta subunit
VTNGQRRAYSLPASSTRGLTRVFREPRDAGLRPNRAPKVPLYLVSFKQHELWLQYSGSAADMLYADIFENWLEAER